MSATEPQLDRVQQRQHARLERMGLACRVMPGGRTVLVSLPLSGAPFESLSGALSIDRVLFATVGADHIKCLRPRPLFSLPLIDVRRCADAPAIEAAIRQAFRNRTRELQETARALTHIGVEVGAIEGGSVLAFPLSGESPDRPVLMHRMDEAILPTTGPLAGQRLAGPEERIVDVSGKLVSAAELDLLLGTRLASLARTASERVASKATAPVAERSARLAASDLSGNPLSTDAAALLAESPANATNHARRREPKVLLVGAHLIENADLRDELKRQGYRVATARSEPEALTRLASMTPDLVISQYALGRSDGATFVQAIRTLPGIVRIPVVLLDDTHHASRQQAARAVGAAGYVIEPFETTRFVTKLGRVAVSPGDRRYARYSDRLAARLTGQARACVATEIGRGGFFLATAAPLDDRSEAHCEISVPELQRSLSFVGEILYRSEQQGVARQGIGVRICEMSAEDEAALIRYVTMRARQA